MRISEDDYQRLLHRLEAPGPGRSVPAREMTHTQLQNQVMEVCKQLGNWRFYHTFNSKRSEPGFPDLVLVRPHTESASGRLVFSELKTKGDRPTIPQQHWLDDLAHSVAGVETYLWYPSDLSNIVEILLKK
jgi:hypothetical protein